ncbi:hypothetical protein M0G43_09250 [Subsaxibacter sp. CAU 1640]|uniref:hypothetical protein n=1 Tax=Subsaxibacter sp. CAU 1640 TaxID=2933271 RepID=UPI002006C8AD|nr:hypothetical protein [Subsaxibacter sp. CAU 1640]MCK7590759.1 hypothetical protein [Subsaxibacter sp. CAU 1640]
MREEEDEKVRKRVSTSITNVLTHCGDFIAHATTLGGKYITNKPLYQLANLKVMETEAYALVAAVDVAFVNWKYAVAVRKDEFEGLQAVCALVIAEVTMDGASEVTVEQLRTIMRLLRGERKTPKDPKKPDTNYRSVSQMDFDMIVSNFATFLTMVGADENYDPATETIKLVTLQAKLEVLRSVNTNALVAEAELDAARAARNEFFNTAVTGLCDVFNKAKNVVLINFGRKSEQYAKVKGLVFRKISVR